MTTDTKMTYGVHYPLKGHLDKCMMLNISLVREYLSDIALRDHW